MKHIFATCWLFCIALSLSATPKEVKLKFIETSDVHGNYLPYDFIDRSAWGGSLARVYSYVEEQRTIYGENLFLFDNGDILQGQPSAYYYNFIDTVSTHLCADMMNFMRYDAGNMGNHDVETGFTVYNRFIHQCNFPILGANIIRNSDGEPYLKPYEIYECEGVKIAVLAMITPAVPAWISESFYTGLYFQDMEECARKWMPIIKEKENPDIIIGLFHAGRNARIQSEKYREDASVEVAQRIPGFDIVMMGHDHSLFCGKVANNEGDSVLVINPANNARKVADIEVVVTIENGEVIGKEITGMLADTDNYEISEVFMEKYASQFNAINDFISRKIAVFENSISTRESYFGPSAFVDLIHTIQLDVTGAEISFAAPLSFNTEIHEGDIRISDMFKLYKFENYLYVMSLSGKEIKGVLEDSYGMWINDMKSMDDHLLLLSLSPTEKPRFKNFYFNFDSAAGIIYTVDVTKPRNEKVTIISMADGTPFDMNKLYKVAITSYRGNGGGELLTNGASIPQDELSSRILYVTPDDLRLSLIKYIEGKKKLNPQPLNQWKFIPEDWVKPAAEKDYNLLFGVN